MNSLFKSLAIILVILIFSSCEKKPSLPAISTSSVTEISTTSAVSGGNITDDGGAQIISKGICWNTSTDPTIDNKKTIVGGGDLLFTSDISQILPATTYYVRAYATNKAGTGYGKSVSFKTLGDKPASDALNASNITINSATLNGSINSNLLSTTVTFEYGVSTNYGSTVSAMQSPVSGDTDGNFTVNADLSGFTPGTTYHFRIKAENSLGVTYSSDLSFTTLGQVPTAITQTATNLQVRTATIISSVNPNYLSTIVSIEWGTSTSYGNSATPAQNLVTGNTTEIFSIDLAGLTPGTTYHFRVKATNELGTANGDDLTFTTLGTVPTAIANNVSNLQVNTATLNGSVNPNFLQSTAYFEWGYTTNYGNTTTSIQSPITGNSSSNISVDLSGLNPETTYHFRIKSTNELGTTYSDDLTFTTYALKDVDNNLYHSVTIGTQTWMQSNLKTTHYKDNSNIPLVTENAEWSYLTSPGYCWYNNSESIYKDTYGALYNWYTISTNNICPSGWHVPSDVEWMTLINFLGGNSVAGTKLKETGSLHWGGPNPIATNVSGFTALPAGDRVNDGVFGNLTLETSIWHSTEYSAWAGQVIYIHLLSSADILPWNKQLGASIRCIKD